MSWKYIELDDAIDHGVLKDGSPFWEMHIQGWNDEEEFSDLTTLITIRTVLSGSKVKTYKKFLFPDLRDSPSFERMIAEAEIETTQEAKSWKTSN